VIHRLYLVLSLLAAVPAVLWATPQNGVDSAELVQSEPAPISIGIIGLDTSHVVAFTKLINYPGATGDLATMRVTAAYPGGTDLATSRDRIQGFTEQVAEMGVEIVDSIDDLLQKVDVVLLESVDGRVHLEQARLVIAAGKPMFIDKPLAASLVDAILIDDLARESGVPWFSSSSLRQGASIPEGIGDVVGCSAWGPAKLEGTHPDLFWYGIHGVETLFTVMGPGCESVTRVQTSGSEFVTGIWPRGRVGTFRGIREGKSGYGAMVFGTKGIGARTKYAGYGALVNEIARFFRTHELPVPNAETLEIYAFMEAADESKRRGGVPVTLASVMQRARAEAAERR
jgi:hypothetical protein